MWKCFKWSHSSSSALRKNRQHLAKHSSTSPPSTPLILKKHLSKGAVRGHTDGACAESPRADLCQVGTHQGAACSRKEIKSRLRKSFLWPMFPKMFLSLHPGLSRSHSRLGPEEPSYKWIKSVPGGSSPLAPKPALLFLQNPYKLISTQN